MNKQHFIDYLTSEVKAPDNSLIAGHESEEFERIEINFKKDFNFDYNGQLIFKSCTFNDNLSLRGRNNLKFVDCKFLNIDISQGNSINFNVYNAKEIVVSGTVRKLIFSNSKSKIDALSITGYANSHLTVMNCDFNLIQLANRIHKVDLSFLTMSCDKLLFDSLEMQQGESKIFFHEMKIIQAFTFIKSELHDIVFEKCNFESAVHVVKQSEFDNIKFYHTKWFKKIYTSTIITKPTFIRKVKQKLKKKLFKNEKNIVKYRERREYYEMYRRYKLMMTAEKNRSDEIYFKSKEYNAQMKQLSLRNRFSDKVILWLNCLSNNHGRYWFISFLWVLTFGALFFVWYISNTSLANDSNAFSLAWDNSGYYLRFLNPIRKVNIFEDGQTIKQGAVVADSIYRIIGAFFLYQGIAAFRKFKD